MIIHSFSLIKYRVLLFITVTEEINENLNYSVLHHYTIVTRGIYYELSLR